MLVLRFPHHIRDIRWFHLLKVWVVEVGPSEVKAPGCVSIVKEMAKVSPTVILFVTRTQLTQRNDPGIC